MAKQHRRDNDITDEGPNLIPIMNLMTILIPFLLLSAVFVKISILNTSLPTAGADAPVQEQKEEPEEDDTPKLNLTVTITDKGFTVAGSGAVLPGASGEGPTVPKTADGEYDFDGLSAKMIDIKKKFPEEKDCIIIPEQGTPEKPGPGIRYQVIIDTMDAVREAKEPVVDSDGDGKADRVLFPGVIFGAGIG